MQVLVFWASVLLCGCQGTPVAVPRVELSALVEAPDKYDGKEVIVSGLVEIAEGRYMILPAAPVTGRKDLLYLAVDRSKLPPVDELMERYLKWPHQLLVATLRGRFTVGREQRFGHLNVARFKLDVNQVLSLEEYKRREGQHQDSIALGDARR